MLNTILTILNRFLASNYTLTSPYRNPVLRWMLKKTFYAQFCAGENRAEVLQTAGNMKEQGYRGIILEFALEVLKPEPGSKMPGAESKTTKKDIEKWRIGMLDTVTMAEEGDFVGLKYVKISRTMRHTDSIRQMVRPGNICSDTPEGE